MTLKLKKPIASNAGEMDKADIHNVKRALNRLGYYTPMKETGITDIPDRAMFDALKSFQSDQEITPTAEMRPKDETHIALNKEEEKQKKYKIQYTWRTVGDNKVRSGHRALDDTVRIAGKGLDPGEDPGCRCWMTNVRLVRDCSEEKQQVDEAQARVRELSKKFNDLLIELNKLIEENKRLINQARKNLGASVVTYLLTLPINKISFLKELLQRYFANIMSEELLQGADKFMRQRSVNSQKIQYIKGQRDLVLAQLESAANKLEEAKKRLEDCERKDE